MKKQLLTIIVLIAFLPAFAQFSTGTVTLSGTMSVKIDTDGTNVTLTLIGPSSNWLGIGFGGASMSTASDMFIWSSSSTNRDYTSTGQSTPSADASQSWTIVSENVISSIRTIVATRTLASSGDYTFSNTSSSIPIIWAIGNGTSLGSHSNRASRTLTRTSLGVEDFSLNSASIFPNPSNGNFKIEAKSTLTKVNVYTQSGAFVKSIELDGNTNNVEVNLKELASGIYLIELKSDSDKAWKKIIKE
jgi:hypothetical protein